MLAGVIHSHSAVDIAVAQQAAGIEALSVWFAAFVGEALREEKTAMPFFLQAWRQQCSARSTTLAVFFAEAEHSAGGLIDAQFGVLQQISQNIGQSL
jgi:hypothetical protein